MVYGGPSRNVLELESSVHMWADYPKGPSR